MMSPARPNLLLLMADQHAAHMMSCAGATHVATPALDALAGSGTRYTRAYATFPLCVPSRASMMTGLHPHQVGVAGNGADTEPARTLVSLGHLLRAQGYDTAYAGKWHAVQPSAAAADGFEVISPFGDRGLAEAACDWLRNRAGQEQPFALVVSFDDPHSICELARRQPSPYGEVGTPPPPRDLPPLPANHGQVPYEAEALRYEQERAAASYGTLAYGPDDWRRYRWSYARLVERADSHVGAVLAGLRDAGLAEGTVVVYTSDHGDGDASHHWNQKTALYEECCLVPLIVVDPRDSAAPTTSSRLVSVGTDLLPTLLALAGADLAPPGEGVDLTSFDTHEAVVVETGFASPLGGGTAGRALVTERFKYVLYSWGAHREQLFDLQADPGECRNLAEESAYDEVREGLRSRLLDWCLRTDDKAFLKRLVLPADRDPGVLDRIFAVPY